MKSKILVVSALLACVSIPAAAQQTSAGASEAAKKIVHEGPLSSTVIPVFDVDKAAAAIPAVARPAASDVAFVPATTTTASKKDEAYWRGRATPLQENIAAAAAKVGPLQRRIADLTSELSGIGPRNARRGGVETERQRLITEGEALNGTLRTDRAALASLEEEGRRAGALPGWFK